MTDTPKILSIVELPDAIKASFETIYRYEKTIEALHAKHIEPVAAERTAVWRDLKAGADMTRKDLELGYRIFKRWQEAQDMEDEAEGARIQANIKRLFAACKAGDTINFLQALDLVENGETIEDDVERAEASFMATESAPAPIATAAKAEAPEINDGPDADWGDDQGPVPAEDDSGHDAGFAYQLGEEAGLAGQTDVRAVIRSHGKHGRSAWAKSFIAGHAAGFKRRQEQQPAQAADTVVAFERPIPLPTVSDNVATSAGDAA